MNKPVTHSRATRILECYGGQPEAWPAEERAATLFLIKSCNDLKVRQEEAIVLDDALAMDCRQCDEISNTIDYDALARRIMDQLPPQEQTGKLAPGKKHKPWKYSLAASLAISTIAALLILSQPHHPSGSMGGMNEFEQWAWGQFFTEETQEQDTSILASAFPAISIAEPSLLSE